MDRNEKALELLERAKKLGLRVEFQSGLNILRRPASADPETINSISEQLMKYLPEIRSLSQGRAIAELGKNHVGSRIFSTEGAGTLLGVSDDGTLTVRVGTELRNSDEDYSRHSQVSISAPAASVLILVEEAAAPPEADVKVESPKKRSWF